MNKRSMMDKFTGISWNASTAPELIYNNATDLALNAVPIKAESVNELLTTTRQEMYATEYDDDSLEYVMIPNKKLSYLMMEERFVFTVGSVKDEMSHTAIPVPLYNDIKPLYGDYFKAVILEMLEGEKATNVTFNDLVVFSMFYRFLIKSLKTYDTDPDKVFAQFGTLSRWLGKFTLNIIHCFIMDISEDEYVSNEKLVKLTRSKCKETKHICDLLVTIGLLVKGNCGFYNGVEHRYTYRLNTENQLVRNFIDAFRIRYSMPVKGK